MQFDFIKATIKDIDLLVATRIETLRAANLLPDSADMTFVEAQSREYYHKCLENAEHIAYLAYDDRKPVGCGGISFYQVMPTYHNPSGEKAYIMNMYTRPEYRRRGIANKILDLLVGEAKQRNIMEITLEATAAGRPLYERYGFVQLKDEMKLPSNS